jgi:2-keto-myo-inositol isomerase
MDDLQDRIALHTWTLDTTPVKDVLRIAREAGYAAIELRYIDFERALKAGLTREQYLDSVRASGVKVAVMGIENNIIFAQGEERTRLFASFEVSCANAVALGCETLMISPGNNSPTSVQHASENYRRAGEIAQRHGLQLALEFSSRHPLLNRTAVAREIATLAGLPNCGLLLDAYHLQCVGEGGRSFENIPLEEIKAFQFSDVPAGAPAVNGAALDRLPPGKGIVDWIGVFSLLMDKGYAGYLSYEAPNPAHWSLPADEVAHEGITAARRLIEKARKVKSSRSS